MGRRRRNSKYSAYLFQDMKGTRCHRWLVIRPVDKDKGGQWRWECQCDCGNIRVVRGGDLRCGGSKSCGCYAVKVVSKHIHKENQYPQRHKHSKHPLYKIWSGMIERYIRHPITVNYTICDSWKNDSVKFIKDLENMGWTRQKEIQIKEGFFEFSPENVYLEKKGTHIAEFHKNKHPEMRNLVGKRFGHLVVLEDINRSGNLFCSCKCDCGNKFIVLSRHLVYEQTKTCGCKRGGKWSMWFDKCQACHRNDRKHHSRGICSGCRCKLRNNGEWEKYKPTKAPYKNHVKSSNIPTPHTSP